MDWRKSSYSADDGNCAEAASAAGSVLVRDTRNRAGVTLSIPAGAWRAFAAQLRGSSAELPERTPTPTQPTRPGGRFRAIVYVYV
jgi:hypothetical protein